MPRWDRRTFMFGAALAAASLRAPAVRAQTGETLVDAERKRILECDGA